MALTEITCPECSGTGKEPWPGGDCLRCWGQGVVERQYGPQDTDAEVSDRPRPGSDWAIFARWEQKREQQG